MTDIYTTLWTAALAKTRAEAVGLKAVTFDYVHSNAAVDPLEEGIVLHCIPVEGSYTYAS